MEENIIYVDKRGVQYIKDLLLMSMKWNNETHARMTALHRRVPYISSSVREQSHQNAWLGRMYKVRLPRVFCLNL